MNYNPDQKNTNPIEKGKFINLNRFPKTLSITVRETHEVLLPAYLESKLSGENKGRQEVNKLRKKFIQY